MKSFLIDTNVVLDVLLDRQPFADAAARLFARVEAGEFEGYVTATSITTIFYVVRKIKGAALAHAAVERILAQLSIASVSHTTLKTALTLAFDDFEDAVQYACALENHLDAIVSRDRDGFATGQLPVLTPANL